MTRPRKTSPSSPAQAAVDADFAALFAEASTLARRNPPRPAGAFTLREYCERNAISNTTGQRHITALMAAGRLQRIGAGNSVFYVRVTPAKD